MKICPICLKEYQNDGQFCDICGGPLKDAEIVADQRTNHKQESKDKISDLLRGIASFWRTEKSRGNGGHSRKITAIATVIAGLLLFCIGMYLGTKHFMPNKNLSTERKLIKTSSDEENEKMTDNESKIGNNAGAFLFEVDDALCNYIQAVLMANAAGSAIENPIEIKLTDAEIIRAAVLASGSDDVTDSLFIYSDGNLVPYDDKESESPDYVYHGMSVSNQSVEQKCRDFFGIDANWDGLQEKGQCRYYDAVKYTDATGTYALIIDSEVESEMKLESHGFKIKENDDGYVGEVEAFWGYWGKLVENPEYSNYVITYELRPNEKSSYGFVVTAIRITKIEDESGISSTDLEADEEGQSEQIEEVSQNQPFYGVWCYASRNQSEAQDVAEDLIRMGFNARVYLSSEWENLNQERWYCVSADSCITESEAEEILHRVQDIGRSDAYIKYSGTYIGT